jgi:hypothetical protein
MAEEPPTPEGQGLAVPRAMMWTGLLVCVALILLFFIARAEVVRGQLADAPAAIMVVVALMLGTALRGTRAGVRLVEIVVKPRPLLLVSLVAFVVLAVGTVVVLGTSPVSADESAHLFQARLFAQFKVTATYPPGLLDRIISPYIQNNVILVGSDGRVMSVYWPGWALLMTPFVWLGVPWLLGPTMAALGVYVTGRLASLLAGPTAVPLAILFTVVSGSFLVNGMSLYPAGGYLTLNLLFAWLLIRGGKRDALLAGLVGGLALNVHNPVPHALFAVAWLVWLVADSSRRRRLVWLAAGYAPWLLVSCAWLLLTTSLRASAPGDGSFWVNRLPLLFALPSVGVVGLRFWELVRLWVWAAPGLLILAVLGWRRTPRYSPAWVLGVAFGLTVVLYAFFPASQGLGWGARYYQSAWAALPILAAILLLRPGNEALRRMAVVSALAGLLLVVPIELLWAHDTSQLTQAGNDSVAALTAPGVNLWFVDYTVDENPSAPQSDNPSLSGPLVFISQGPAADQALVDRYFPGARLVVRTSFGSGYARP